MTPFRHRHGRVETTFELAEGRMLSNLARQVIELLHDRNAPPEAEDDPLAAEVGMTGAHQPPEDPVLRRLLPDGYSDDEEESAEFRKYTEQSLTLAKVDNARTLLDSLDDAGINDNPPAENLEVELDDIQIPAWLRALNDMRLSLAVRLGIDSEDEAAGLEQAVVDAQNEEAGAQDSDSESSEHMMREVYLWLGYVQESLVGALE